MKKFILSICCLLFFNIFIGINAMADGKAGWQFINNNYWIYNEGSSQLCGCAKIIDGKSYSFTKNGVWIDDTNYDEPNEAKGMDTVSITYKLSDMTIDSVGEGSTTLKMYWGGSPENKSKVEATYGIIIVDAHDYNMTAEQLMDKNWKTDLQIVKNEDGSVSLRVNN